MHKERQFKLVDHLDYGELGHKVIETTEAWLEGCKVTVS